MDLAGSWNVPARSLFALDGGSLPQRRAAPASEGGFAGIRRHVQTMLWVRACHSAMVLTLSMLRTRTASARDYVLGRWRTPRSRPAPCKSSWRRHRSYGFAGRPRGMAVPIGVGRLRHRHEGLGQRFDVVELSEAAVGEMLARSRALLPGQGVVHRQHPAHVEADGPTHRRWRCSWCRWRIGRCRPAKNHCRPSS